MVSKKCNVFLIFVLIGVVVLTGCGSPRAALEENKINVMTSFYPLYDFAQKIGGEHVNVINLVPTGVDPHDWAPKPQDMANINNADLFIYNGLGFEGWVDGFLGGLKANSNLVSVVASNGIDAIVGSQDQVDEHEEHDDHDDDDEHEDHVDDGDHASSNDEHDHGKYDPHIWLSPLQAKKMAENVKDALIQIDTAHSAEYEANYSALIDKLDELHLQYVDVTSKAPKKSIVVSHEAYGYLVRDYGLIQVGIMGLSTSAEPTIQTMKYITDYVKDNDVHYILFEELASPKLAQTLADDAGIDILVFNPIEGLTDEQVANGEDYISIMKNNLTSLGKALQ